MRTIEVGGEKFTVREAIESEMGLVFSTWMESARDLHSHHVRRNVFNHSYPDLVTRLLKTEPVYVLIREGKDVPHAWACGREPNVLHFAYVPFDLRGNGLGREVINACLEGYPKMIWVTSSPLAIRNHARFVYNPFIQRHAA